ncbi:MULTISPECIES: HupE/UreJ family protein [unclassified Devosia]|uniref:HupE/UreJ family protein n=1 Tax=unclassified Devosia TaxID=196773 RepID=UPI00145EF568|nr:MULTISPECIES: HupE/UreJ family protein [unclassified Devosia]MBJ6986658.1 HupE/UreJ family protein [Devosia sp. MC521]QMW61694.1 HupE/UreJ family protein [Devosia sp. MC521]
MLKRLLLALALTTIATVPAFAHLDPEAHGSFAAGFSHPLLGLDHILAMVAVGLWAAQQSGRTIWLVPAAFVGTMALGFLTAILGMPLPMVEPVILASVIFIGLGIALALPVPPVAVAGLVAFFAFFHGHAHGGELGAAGASQFALGFIVATAILHAVGIGAAQLFARLSAPLATRLVGAATASAGAWLAFA